ncbi:hypothetical protein JOS77_20270 [Chromobacterium haemolyticum]|nr:hypothetical protein JOS77_20270 [Chromobacterium haemolyticum]
MTVLNAQLDEANNQLRKQRDENAMLAERLGLLLEALPAGVVQVSAEGVVTAVNPAASRMLNGCSVGALWRDMLAGLLRSELDDTYCIGMGSRVWC